jgi:hypothetical protein
MESTVSALEAADPAAIKHTRPRVASLLHKALIFKQAGNMARYVTELDAVEDAVFFEKKDQTLLSIRAEIEKEIVLLPLTPELAVVRLSGYIEQDDKFYLKDLVEQGDDLQDILGSAYGMLVDQNEDPDKIFRRAGIL